MTSLYEITYYGIEQHITLTLPAWLYLFTVRITCIGWYMLLEHQVIWCQGEAAGPNHGARKAYTNRLSTWFAPKI